MDNGLLSWTATYMFAPITAQIPVGIRRPPSKGWTDHGGRPDQGSHLRTIEGQVDDRIDDAYRAKYQSSPYLKPMISTHARSATVRIVPRE
jgi:hypothetical protein